MYEAKMESIKDCVESIIKSSEDKRFYRGLVLQNDMRVLLISDPTTDKSAASVNVCVGHMSDPEDLPGLAHFCEHMLFLGTQKYPAENEYHKFLSEHGGYGNASTSGDQTNYYFDIAPEHLGDALDRFASFFLCPLFTDSATEREVNAVNSEFEKNLPNEDWRLDQLDRTTAKEDHAYHRFGAGNKITLSDVPKEKGINVRDELLKFHDAWYSSNIMNLCVLGKESLDELQDMIIKLFSDVKNKNVDPPYWNDHPYGPDQLQLKGYIVPIKDIRALNVMFPLPDLTQYYKSNPGYYVSHLLAHEGPGSLLSALKARGWCNSLIGGTRVPARGFSFFSVHVDLTQDGINRVDDIVKMIFQYVNMLKMVGPQEWFFEEMRALRAIHFRFKDVSSPRNYVSYLSMHMHLFPMEEVLSGNYLCSDWRPDLIDMILNLLIPENVRVAVVAKRFQPNTDQVEKWYEVQYKLEKIPESTIREWNEAGINTHLTMPPKNEFIPSDFTLLEKEENAPVLHPILLKDSPLTRAWFKQDEEYNLPKASIRFEFASPMAYLDPVSCIMTYLFVELFVDSFTELTYAAELAGMSWSLSATKYGITLTISGYNDKQEILLKMIMKQLTDFKIDKIRYSVLKEKYMRELKNLEAEQPFQHAMKFVTILLAQQAWTKDDLLAAIDDMQFNTLELFIPQFLSKLHIECLIHGNVNKKKALELVQLVEDQLHTFLHICPLLPYQLLRNRELMLEDGCNYLLEVYTSIYRNSCVDVYYQCGLQSTHSNMLLRLLVKIMSEPCFHTLRTVEQLGYIVACDVRKYGGVQGLRIIVQSNRHPKYVDRRIETFLHNMKQKLVDLSEEAFCRLRDSLAAQLLEKPKTMEHLTVFYWAEISSHQFHFDRVNVEVSFLRTLEKSDITKFFNEMICCDSSRRHKLAVHVLSMAEGGAGTVEEKSENEEEALSTLGNYSEPKLIQNITEFKSCHGMFPLIEPYIKIHQPTKSKL